MSFASSLRVAFSAAVLTGIVLWAGGCSSVEIGPGSLKITGIDNFTVRAIGLEDALTQSLAHVRDLEKHKDSNGRAIMDWNETIQSILKAKSNDSGAGTSGQPS